MLLSLLYFLLVSTACEAVGSKKGIGINSGAFKCGDTWKFSGVSWWYDWRYDQGERLWHHCPSAPRSGYIPMVFNSATAHTAIIPADAKYVLGFNEPNMNGQAEMSPEQCAESWPLVQRKAGNRYLVGPALAGCGLNADKCIQWFETFFRHCKNCRVNALAVHDYYHCGDRHPSELMAVIEKISKHFNRKIWLTEFSCRGNVSVDDHLKFMKTILPLLERSPYVEKYAWFANRIKAPNDFLQTLNTELLEHNTTNLSRLGQYYNNFHL